MTPTKWSGANKVVTGMHLRPPTPEKWFPSVTSFTHVDFVGLVTTFKRE